MSRPPRPWTVPITTVLIALATAAPAAATDLFVKPSGSGSTCSQASPCSLSTAISTAGSGDTVFVAAGTYTGTGDQVVLLDKTITLLGGWNGAPTGAATRDRIAYPSILDGQNARRVVTITGSGSADPTVDGFTITRGDATGLVTDCDGSSADPFGCGGGIFVYDAGPTISNNVITRNVAAAPATADPTGCGYGGGIYAYNPKSLVIVHNTISENTATTVGNGFGGGIGISNCLGECRVEGNRIVDNVAGTAVDQGAWGGGLALAGWSDHAVVVEENLFRGNQATDVGYAEGDDIYTWYAAFTIRRNCVWGSHAAEPVFLGHVAGSFDGNTVLADTAGFAVDVQGGRTGSTFAARNNIIAGGQNSTVEVTAWSDPLTVSFAHNTIVGTGSTIGVEISDAVTATLTDNIVAGHSVGIELSGAAAVTIDHALFWGNTADGVTGTGAVFGDPRFANAPRGDYHIGADSAAIGAGTDAGVTDDIDGEARPGAGGLDIGADEVPPRRFDFGTASSPVAADYVQVTNAMTYAAGRGYGWLSGTISARDRATGSDLTRDFNFTPLGTFVVDVANGRYTVSLTLGDATAGHGQMGVSLEGTQVASVTTAAGEFKTVTADVSVGDGQLTLVLDDLGGSDPNVVVNALTIDRALPVSLDFGTASSPVAPGYSRISNSSAYSQAAGSGWRGGVIQARDRGTAGALKRDFNFTPLGLFGIFLQNGLYDLTVTLGDATGAHEQMGVSVQGAAPDSISTARNQFVTRTWHTCVCDNGLGTLLDDLGGADANVVVNAIEAREPPLLHFDFGTPTSPLFPGYLQVTPSTGYTVSRGYGWASGTIGSRDRGGVWYLGRDFNFTPDGTFVVDVRPGRYEVRVLMGDATTAHDEMGIYLEETLVRTQDTLAGSIGWRTFTVDVTDGQLTVHLDDLGGSDANVVINALEVR